MKKFKFVSLYKTWNEQVAGNTISNIRMIDEFQAMINSDKEALIWIYELMGLKSTWMLIMLTNGLYEKHNIDKPKIPEQNRGKFKQISQIHLEHLKQQIENL